MMMMMMIMMMMMMIMMMVMMLTMMTNIMLNVAATTIKEVEVMLMRFMLKFMQPLTSATRHPETGFRDAVDINPSFLGREAV